MLTKSFIMCFTVLHTVGCMQINRTSLRRREENNYIKKRHSPVQQLPIYKRFPPIKLDTADEYITSYEADYGASSNFTGSAYDDNTPLYPNPENLVRKGEVSRGSIDFPAEISDTELPDESLADADLKDHNIIDSVSYIYGYASNNGFKYEWILLVYISRVLACIIVIIAAVHLLFSESAKDFRDNSELYPVNINLLSCLVALNMIFMEAILGASSESRCEMVALLLHYAHLVCAAWLLVLCCCVCAHCTGAGRPPLKYIYLLAYGVPAVLVLFNYALSMEQYETKRYCWMSLEKGMLLGFMLPGTVLILLTTALALLALRSVHRKQSEIRAAKIQELIEQHAANLQTGSTESLPVTWSLPASRHNTDSDDHLEREYDEEFVCNSSADGRTRSTSDELADDFFKLQSIKFDLMNMSVDNLSWKSASFDETNALKGYLHFCLVIQPYYAIVWVMGVVALENSGHWLTPSVFLVICTSMYAYIAVQICTNLLTLHSAGDDASCCEGLISEQSLTRTRTTDSIPLLDTASSPQPVAPPVPSADTISTISI